VIRKTVPDGRCGNVEATFAKFCRCSLHWQVATLSRPQSDMARHSALEMSIAFSIKHYTVYNCRVLFTCRIPNWTLYKLTNPVLSLYVYLLVDFWLITEQLVLEQNDQFLCGINEK